MPAQNRSSQTSTRCDIVAVGMLIDQLRRSRQEAEVGASGEGRARALFEAGKSLEEAVTHIPATTLAGALLQIRLAYLAVDELRSSHMTEDAQDELADRLDRLLGSAAAAIQAHVGKEAEVLARYQPRPAEG